MWTEDSARAEVEHSGEDDFNEPAHDVVLVVEGETLEQFTSRMNLVEKEEEFEVGPRHAGHSRAIFCFEGQYAYFEQLGFTSFEGLGLPSITKAIKTAFAPEPRTYWWTDFEAHGKARCLRIARHYNCRIEESPYSEEDWWNFHFDTFKDLMRFVFDRHTGAFEKLFGEES